MIGEMFQVNASKFAIFWNTTKPKNKLAGKEKNMKTTSYVPIVVLEFLHSKIFGNY